MKTLTYDQLHELAPGSAPLNSAVDPDGLLDTDTWLDQVYGKRFLPVFAMQGKTHEDSTWEPWQGRHLVVCAREDGVALSLLNSHCRLQRVWCGIGVWSGASLQGSHTDGELLLAHVLPVKRWKRAGEQVDQLLTFADRVGMERDHMMVPARGREELAAKIARGGYIGGRGRPSATALMSGLPAYKMPVLDTAFALVAAARKGNLEPSGKDKSRRNVKGIRRPDAYQHLALAAWRAAVEVAS